MDSTIGSPVSTKPFDEVSEASPKPSAPPSDEKPTMMLAPTTKQSQDRERTLIEDTAKPTFENSDSDSNGKGDIEGGNISEESKKDGGSGISMDRKKLILIILGIVLLISILGGSIGANAYRKKENNTTSTLAADMITDAGTDESPISSQEASPKAPTPDQEMNTRPPVSAPDQEMNTKPPVSEQNRATDSPTLKPTISILTASTSSPTVPPAPTNKPTASPTVNPTASPTIKNEPTATPTISPAPTKNPTTSPTATPTTGPTISPEPTGIPSASPTTDYVALIQNYLSGTHGVDVFSWSKAMQKNMLAIEWLASEAKEANNVELNGKFLQRFVLLTQDLSVQGAKGAWDLPRNAQKEVDECDWNGVVCDSDNWVTEILWPYQEGKKGSISPELRHLVGSLKVLDLSNNEMKEEIPEELYELTNLEKLILFNNELKGTISPKIGDLDSITHFHLSHNKLKGPFPVEIKSDDGIRPLVYFNVYSNKLTGTLPEDMRLRSVTYFDVGRNLLSGKLPVTLGEKFVSLRHLHLDHNYFTGTLPLSYNTVGNGRLESFSIDHNYLTGRVPGTRDLYNKLVQYTLHSNEFDSMSSNVCRMEVPRGEMVELRTDCAICICEGFFDLCDIQCLEEPSESPTESPTESPDDDDK